eukprot:GHVP01064427.1.p1 GENE.GHVP01064427.1~~GHVP01064427.1.p1  ORF type:complete len:108 (-),score=7.47 GHVP01064427.1:8-331(-)
MLTDQDMLRVIIESWQRARVTNADGPMELSEVPPKITSTYNFTKHLQLGSSPFHYRISVEATIPGGVQATSDFPFYNNRTLPAQETLRQITRAEQKDGKMYFINYKF